jgi:putative two-component system response regulator
MNNEKKIILVVDDVPDNIQLLSGLLKADYKIKAATSGNKAIIIANKSPQPDLILLDVIMPEMDGHEVCKILKSETSTKHIPIVFVSGNTSAEEIKQGLDLGATGYLGKPIDSSELIALIHKILSHE